MLSINRIITSFESLSIILALSKYYITRKFAILANGVGGKMTVSCFVDVQLCNLLSTNSQLIGTHCYFGVTKIVLSQGC